MGRKGRRPDVCRHRTTNTSVFDDGESHTLILYDAACNYLQNTERKKQTECHDAIVELSFNSNEFDRVFLVKTFHVWQA